MTGAAVGLGAVVVGQAVRHFTQPDGLANNPGTQAASSQGAQAANNPLPSFANDLGPASGADMGGNDFGINDTASWDSNADSGSGGGGSDWE